ncbi:hypothetical protein [Amycolatopsis nigrescens]|uniref:hypothetical protein n=1 Tax=Amycolatopsis nigrescens TaxID=381445 RepID=UPI00036481DB|nr:hypothetical protein [Amycolatopsis nigrescens]
MAPTPDPQPGHADIQQLDPAFTHAPELAGWLEYLAHPEDHYGPRRVRETDIGTGYTGDPKEVKSKIGGRTTDVGSVMQDLTVRGFFAAADVLSGQDLDSIGNAVALIEELRHRKDGTVGPLQDTADVYERMDTALGLVLPNWTDDAGVLVGEVYADMHVWYTRRTEDLFVMSKRLIEFGAAIATARKNLNNLMSKLVDSLHAHTEDDVWDDVLFFLLEHVVGFALGKLDPSGATGLGYSVLYDKAIKRAESDTVRGGLTGDQYYTILGSYLVAARSVCESAAVVVDKAVTGSSLEVRALKGLRTGMPTAPVLG